jgi:hypothetical protein
MTLSTAFTRTVDRLRDERGMALVMALGVAMVLTIAALSLVTYSMLNEHHASRTRTDVRAYNLAQAGIENAVAQLGNTSLVPKDQRDDPNILAGVTKQQTFNAGEQVVWDAQLWDDRGGAHLVTAPLPANYIGRLRWHVTSTSTAPNPAVPGGSLTRQLQADVRLTPDRRQPTASEAWRFIYSKRDDNGNTEPDGCDLVIPNNPGIQASFYVTGDLCLYNNSQIEGPGATDVIVGGWVYNVSPQAWIGTLGGPLLPGHTEIGGKCKHRNRSPKDPASLPPGPPVGCWTSEHFVSDAVPKTTNIVPPDVSPTDFDLWYSLLASPGPANPCDPTMSSNPPALDNDTSRNNSLGMIDMINMPAFSCKTLEGELTWDPSTNPRTLKVEGTIYIDGGLDFVNNTSPVDIEYTGVGAIYTSGPVRLHQVRLCADDPYSGTVCNLNWNGQGPMLLLVSDGNETSWPGCQVNNGEPDGCGILLETSSAFQGALYATHNIGLQNYSLVQGPMVADSEILGNQFTFYPIPLLTQVPFGTPQTPIIDWNILPPTNYTG